jgi:hypothetical protein
VLDLVQELGVQHNKIDYNIDLKKCVNYYVAKGNLIKDIRVGE